MASAEERPMLDTTQIDESIYDWISTRTRAVSIGALVMAMFLGGYIRFLPAFSGDFPINDGGLFYLMVQEVQRAGYALPAYTSYNGAQIPFAYPPFAFYLAAMVSDVTTWPVLEIIRFFP